MIDKKRKKEKGKKGNPNITPDAPCQRSPLAFVHTLIKKSHASIELCSEPLNPGVIEVAEYVLWRYTTHVGILVSHLSRCWHVALTRPADALSSDASHDQEHD